MPVYAGGGCMVGAIKGSTQKEPLVVGKPSTFMMDHVASKYSNHILPTSIKTPLKFTSWAFCSLKGKLATCVLACESNISDDLDLGVAGLTLRHHRYVWWETDWKLTSSLAKTGVVQLSWFSQVTDPAQMVIKVWETVTIGGVTVELERIQWIPKFIPIL